MTLRLGGDGAITGCTSLENPDLTVSGLTISGSFDAEKVLVASGTAAAPSYTFSGDTDNGLYYAGTNSIGLATAGTNVILIDSAGSVGIGTASPERSFHVDSTSQNIGLFSNNKAAALITFQDTGSTNNSQVKIGSAGDDLRFDAGGNEKVRIDSSGNVGIGLTNISGSGSLTLVAGQSYKFAGSGGSTIYGDISADTSHNITFKNNNGTERMRIDGLGNVGIGTTSIDASLHVKGAGTHGSFVLEAGGTSGASNQIYIQGHNNAGTSLSEIHIEETATNQGALVFKTNGGSVAEAMRIDSAGRVLIGTSTARTNYFGVASTYGPSLNIESTTNSNRVISFIHNDGASGAPLFVLGNSGNNSTPGGTGTVAANASLGFISFQGGDGTELVEAARVMGAVDGTPGANDMPGRLTFHTTVDGGTAPTERMRIDSSGRVGIGVTTMAGGAGELTIIRNSALRWADNDGTQRADIYGDTSNNLVFRNGTSSTERMRIDSSGNLLVGTSSVAAGSVETTEIVGSALTQSTGIHSVAASGTLDLAIKGGTFVGHLYVTHVYPLNASVRTTGIYFVTSRLGNATVITALNNANGSGGAYGFTITNPSANTMRFTNTQTQTGSVSMSFVGTMGF